LPGNAPPARDAGPRSADPDQRSDEARTAAGRRRAEEEVGVGLLVVGFWFLERASGQPARSKNQQPETSNRKGASKECQSDGGARRARVEGRRASGAGTARTSLAGAPTFRRRSTTR